MCVFTIELHITSAPPPSPLPPQPTTQCSDSFPISNYSVNVLRTGDQTLSSTTVTGESVQGQEVITVELRSAQLPNLRQDERYNLSVSACIAITCRDSTSIPLGECVCVCHLYVCVTCVCVCVLYFFGQRLILATKDTIRKGISRGANGSNLSFVAPSSEEE